MLFQLIGWKQTAGAVSVAWDKIQNDGILPDYDTLNLTWVLSDCVINVDAGSVIDWVDSGANVVLGPGCSASAVISGSVAKYFDFPLVIWAPTFSSKLLQANEYPTVMSSTWSSISQARTLIRLFKRYEWRDVAVVYHETKSEAIPRCVMVINDLVGLMDIKSNLTLVYRRKMKNSTNNMFKDVLRSIKDVARVTVVCLESDQARRNLMIAIAEEGMDTNEYMWLMIETRRLGFGDVWKDTNAIPDGKDELALQAAKTFFVIDSEPSISSSKFVTEVKKKMQQPPFNCTDCNAIDPARCEFICIIKKEYYQNTSQVGELADAMLMYANALNRSIAAGISNPTGTELVKFSTGEFEGELSRIYDYLLSAVYETVNIHKEFMTQSLHETREISWIETSKGK
ncbi:ligand-binding protein, receptor family [Dictyocaulus viviparus]|uniref:Ligand-binding protein, receptor family n=1 Tax=Dictyocaulus viviparus TaxID=29172 RepID=A0A0D8XGF5_DICVI|nr:ligand-binding protein, receptor family [Dictyocaulus viviparus]